MDVIGLMAGTSVKRNSEPEYNLDNLNQYAETMMANKIDKSKLRRVSLYITMGGDVLERKNLMPEFSTELRVESSMEYIGNKEIKLTDLVDFPIDKDIIHQLYNTNMVDSENEYISLCRDLKCKYPDKFKLGYSTPRDSYELENKKSQQFDFIMYEGDKLGFVPTNNTYGIAVFKVNSNDIPDVFTVDNIPEDEVKDKFIIVVEDEDLDIECNISYHQSDEHLDRYNLVPFYNIKINKEGKSNISDFESCKYTIESTAQEIDPIALMPSGQTKLPRNYYMSGAKYVERPTMKITSDDNQFGLSGYNIYITNNSDEGLDSYGETATIDILKRNVNSNSTVIPTLGTINFDLLNQGIKYVKHTEGTVLDFRKLVDTICDKLKNINNLRTKFDESGVADDLGSSITYDNSEYDENDRSFQECIALPNHEVIINVKDYEGNPCIESNLFYMLNGSVEDIAERYVFCILFECFIGSESELKELCGKLCPNCKLSDEELRMFGYKQERYNSMYGIGTAQPDSNFLM